MPNKYQPKRRQVDAAGLARLRIGFDARWYFEGPPSNRAVTRELLSQLIAIRSQDEVIAVVHGGRARANELEAQHLGLSAVSVPDLTMLGGSIFIIPWIVAQRHLDVYIAQNFVPLFGSKCKIGLIYDTIYLRRPDLFTLAERAYLSMIKPLAQRADWVCTISDSERKELIRSRVASREMVSVVTLAPRGQFFGVTSQQVATAKAELALPDKYILALGRINKRKNLCALLAGANRANLVTPELPLVLAGPTSGQQEEGLGELLKELGPRARKIGFVPEELIAGLVGGARIMVSLSVVEGFGLPPLEGLAAGVPVLMARSAVANEIMGDAAVFVSDIRDPSEVARALDSLLTSEELREEMAARGRVQLERYSWSRSGAELSSAIDRALVRKVKRNERKTQGTEEKSP